MSRPLSLVQQGSKQGYQQVEEEEEDAHGRAMTRARASLRPGEKAEVSSWRRDTQGNVLQVHIENYKGFHVLCLRSWYPARDGSGRLLPSRDGLNVDVRNLPALHEAMGLALEMAREMGLELTPVWGDAQ